MTRGCRSRPRCVDDAATLVNSFAVITKTADKENCQGVAAQDNAIAVVIDLAFCILLSCEGFLIFPQPILVDASEVIYKMSVKDLNLIIIFVLMRFGRCCDSRTLAVG